MSDPSAVSLQGMNACACCSGLSAETPLGVSNRPGLNAISYRVGEHAEFKASLLAALSDASRSPLQGLRTRDDDDFAIAFLDATATLADVLTFYQERIANESYLRTATERRSLLELARLIGYALRPGVAASAFLAFTLDSSAGAPQQAPIALGARVQSIPGPGQTPQTFETVENIVANVEWNALKPQMSLPRLPVPGDTAVYLQGVTTNLKVGDAILFVGPESDPNHRYNWEFRRLIAVQTDPLGNWTRVDWDNALGSNLSLDPNQPGIYALRQRAALFGFNAPIPATLSEQTLKNYGLWDPIPDDWSFSIDNLTIDLDSLYPSVVAESWIALIGPAGQKIYRAYRVNETSRADFTLAGKTTEILLDSDPDQMLPSFAQTYRSTMAYVQSELLTLGDTPITTPITGAQITLAAPPVNALTTGQRLAASGLDSTGNAALSELVVISAIDSSGMVLTLDSALNNTYARGSFSLNANVAAATHGESVQEALGGGDASQGFQSFRLHQGPLTYVSAANAAGAESTLTLTVNDLLWQEAASFYGHGLQERIYTTQPSNEGVTSVNFGDGVSGARLPTAN